jgi:predicted DNA-binding transcriptional regulator AlpA|uniref:helix-turn-helix domain-containing protein n=1 Tax=Lachnospira eligens TaxID=39485 RepID=UPI004027EF10
MVSQDVNKTVKNERKVVKVESRVYRPEEIMTIMGLSKSKTYQFLNDVYNKKSPFRVIKINTVIRVPKEGFDEWLAIK